MVAFIPTVAALSMAFANAWAAPTESGANNDLVTRSSGQLTYYNPGLGACGETNGDGDTIVAVSAATFDSQHPCNRKIRVSYQGKSVVVRVVDRCAGCAAGDLDLSPSAFEQVVGDMGKGRVSGSWEWV